MLDIVYLQSLFLGFPNFASWWRIKRFISNLLCISTFHHFVLLFCKLSYIEYPTLIISNYSETCAISSIFIEISFHRPSL